MEKALRYSQILGAEFFNIGLTSQAADIIDVHFTAAAHHLIRMNQTKLREVAVFHLRLHRAHLRSLMTIVQLEGDFSNAIDLQGTGLDDVNNWNPDRVSIPDSEMFQKMHADPRFTVGESHSADMYLNKGSFTQLRAI